MSTDHTWSDSPIHEQIRKMNDTPETDELWSWFSGNPELLDYVQELSRRLEQERDEAREYADKLAEGLPEGMLPKDVEVLREANLNLATELTAVTEQRDMLAEALRELCIALLTDKSPDITDLLNKAGAAMADVNYSTAKKSQP